MRRLLLIAASVTPLLFAASTEALAQRQFGGHGFRAGGWHGGAWRGGGGWRGIHRGFYPGAAFRSGGFGWRGSYGPRYRYGGGYPYWGLGAAAATIGALATYPAYPDYYYPSYPVYPVYPAYPAYAVVPGGTGGSCSTPIKMCTLYERAPLGIGCSCRVPGGRARGAVVGP